MLQILVTITFLLAPDALVVRSAPLYVDTYATMAACAKVMDGIGIGAKIRIASIIRAQRPTGAHVASLAIGCAPK